MSPGTDAPSLPSMIDERPSRFGNSCWLPVRSLHCRHYFPWLADHLALATLPHTNQRRSMDSPQRAPLPPDTEALVRAHFRHEVEVHDATEAVHVAQVARVLVAGSLAGQ